MPTVFIAGATGYTGRALVTIARAAGHAVIAHIRPGSASGDACLAAFNAAGATVDRTPWQQEALSETLARVQPSHVFGLLGTTRARGKLATRAGGPAETYQTVDRDLSLLLLHAAEDCGSNPHFVYLSSLGADKPRGNAYLLARAQVEDALRAGGLPWTIARPSLITGPDRPEPRFGEQVAAVLSAAALGTVAALGAGAVRDRYGTLDAKTLAAGLLAAALSPTSGQVLDAAALRRLASQSPATVG